MNSEPYAAKTEGQFNVLGERASGAMNEVMNDTRSRRAALAIGLLINAQLASVGVIAIQDRQNTDTVVAACTATSEICQPIDIELNPYEVPLSEAVVISLPKPVVITSETIVNPAPAIVTATTLLLATPAVREAAPLPAAPEQSVAITVEAAAVTTPETRRGPISYESYLANASEMIRLLPSLDALASCCLGPAMTRDVSEQKQHIEYLNQSMNVTLEGYNSFALDMSRNAAFQGMGDYQQQIQPKMFVIHWTGEGYANVDEFIEKLKPYRVEFFINAQAQSYQLFESDFNMPAHGLGINSFSQGVEIETGFYDDSRSPIFSYTPEQMQNAVYMAVQFLRRNNLPVNNTTLVGHYATDLIFNNPHYNPYTGNLSQNKIRKYDPPQELMSVLVAKAQALDASLGDRS